MFKQKNKNKWKIYHSPRDTMIHVCFSVLNACQYAINLGNIIWFQFIKHEGMERIIWKKFSNITSRTDYYVAVLQQGETLEIN